MSTGIQVINRELLDELIMRARQSPRLRVNHNFHSSMEENPHRFLNVLVKGTYIGPHRHLNPPKAESFLVLEGQVAFFMFDDTGSVVRTDVIGGDAMGIDMAPGIWHTLAPLTPHAVCYEVKPGPYSVTTDKEFAPWAPSEGEAGAAAYLEGLMLTVRSTRA